MNAPYIFIYSYEEVPPKKPDAGPVSEPMQETIQEDEPYDTQDYHENRDEVSLIHVQFSSFICKSYYSFLEPAM